MAKSLKNRASKQAYVSVNQLSIEEFSPFSQKIDPSNRWIILSKQIPWDDLSSVYQSTLKNKHTGADGINPRVAIGALIIKHMCDLSDRETIKSIQENVYMQYFIGYNSFSYEEPFDASLFVGIRKRLSDKKINEINELILNLRKKTSDPASTEITHQGNMIVDATACAQDIAYPTDLDLLNEAREKSERLIAILYNRSLHDKMPRTDKTQGRKDYLNVAQKKNKTKKAITKALRQQLRYVGRNIASIHTLLDKYDDIPLKKQDYKYLLVIQTFYEQQKLMFDTKTHSVADRIVSIHQPHVRPIVRGKVNAKVEFGAKINVSLMNGYSFLDKLSWDAFNEGSHLISSVEKYKERFGFLPQKVLVDKIYCTRDNRNVLKEMGIKLAAKPLGRPKAGVESSVSPGERNPIEGKFGQAKTTYGLGRIKARLASTSESWIASILMVLNLVKLIGEAPLWIMVCIIEKIRFYYRYKFMIALRVT